MSWLDVIGELLDTATLIAMIVAGFAVLFFDWHLPEKWMWFLIIHTAGDVMIIKKRGKP